MVRVTLSRPFDNSRTYYEFAGLSTDDKPTAGVLTGSLFREVDTGEIFAFDETSSGTWYDQTPAAAE